MGWFFWTVISYWVLEAIAYVIMIDEPREPLSKKNAIVTLVWNALFIAGLFHYWGK